MVKMRKAVMRFLAVLLGVGLALTPMVCRAVGEDADVKAGFDTLMTTVKPTLIYIIGAVLAVIVVIILFKAGAKWIGKVGKG